MTINHKVLARQVAIAAELKTSDAQNAVKSVFSALANGLIQRDEIWIPGFGTFRVAHRAARDGRNMATGEKMRIPAKDTAKFVPSKVLKDALNPPPSVPRRKQA